MRGSNPPIEIMPLFLRPDSLDSHLEGRVVVGFARQYLAALRVQHGTMKKVSHMCLGWILENRFMSRLWFLTKISWMFFTLNKLLEMR